MDIFSIEIVASREEFVEVFPNCLLLSEPARLSEF